MSATAFDPLRDFDPLKDFRAAIGRADADLTRAFANAAAAADRLRQVVAAALTPLAAADGPVTRAVANINAELKGVSDRIGDGLRDADERIATASAGFTLASPTGPDLATIFNLPRPAVPVVVIVLPPHPPTH